MSVGIARLYTCTVRAEYVGRAWRWNVNVRGSQMNSEFILNAIKLKCPGAAIVPELSIEDIDLPDSGEESEFGLSKSERPEGHKYMRRIDALMFESLLRKVSVADFKRDTYWKRRAWQSVTHRFIYAVPFDMDVMSPHGCGLRKVDESGRVTVVKKAIVNKVPEPLPQTVVQRLAYRAQGA